MDSVLFLWRVLIFVLIAVSSSVLKLQILSPHRRQKLKSLLYNLSFQLLFSHGDHWGFCAHIVSESKFSPFPSTISSHLCSCSAICLLCLPTLFAGRASCCTRCTEWGVSLVKKPQTHKSCYQSFHLFRVDSTPVTALYWSLLMP